MGRYPDRLSRLSQYDSGHHRTADYGNRSPPRLHSRDGPGHRTDHRNADRRDHSGGPTMTSRRPVGSAGFTMIELMIAMVMISIVMGATISAFRSQTKSFRMGGERLEMFQNIRYAVSTVDRVLRTAGAGVANQQPMFIYGDDDIVAFNSNYTHNLQDNCAVNVNEDAPAGSFEILPQASAYTLPNTAFNYPAMNYTSPSCLAE